MKKILAVIMSLSLVCCFAGCSESRSADEAELTYEATEEQDAEEKKSEETTEAAADKTAEETAAAETEKAAETEEVTEAAPEEEEASGLTEAMLKKMNSWEKGNVILNASMTEDGASVKIYVNKYSDKVLLDMDLIGMFRTKIVYDGEKAYMVNDAQKTYCVTNSDADEENPLNDYMIEQDDAMNITDTGKETIDGSEYTYEEFDIDGEKIRYYFDSGKEVRYLGAYDGGELKVMDFTVKFLDSPDESEFSVPAGYTEISEEEMSMQILAAMFGALEGMEGFEGFEDLG